MNRIFIIFRLILFLLQNIHHQDVESSLLANGSTSHFVDFPYKWSWKSSTWSGLKIYSIYKKNNSIYTCYFKNYEGVPDSQLHPDDSRNSEENLNEVDQDEYVHDKRKSDFLLSLYGLPYVLVNKREP